MQHRSGVYAAKKCGSQFALLRDHFRPGGGGNACHARAEDTDTARHDSKHKVGQFITIHPTPNIPYKSGSTMKFQLPWLHSKNCPTQTTHPSRHRLGKRVQSEPPTEKGVQIMTTRQRRNTPADSGLNSETVPVVTIPTAMAVTRSTRDVSKVRAAARNPFTDHVLTSYREQVPLEVTVPAPDAKKTVSAIRAAARLHGLGVALAVEPQDDGNAVVVFQGKTKRQSKKDTE